MKDMSTREIYANMNNALRTDRIGYSTVPEYLREKSFSNSMLDMDFELKIEEENFIDEAVLGALGECSFSSFRQIAKRILVPMSTVRYHLVNSLGHRIRNFPWVLHSLSSSQKQVRVEMSQDLLHVLRLAKYHARKYIIILDKSWFCFSNHLDRIWLPHDELPPSFSKQTIASQKLMITVIWNPHGFHVIQSLPKGIKWTFRYHSGSFFLKFLLFGM
jgi:hypothetical protein